MGDFCTTLFPAHVLYIGRMVTQFPKNRSGIPSPPHLSARRWRCMSNISRMTAQDPGANRRSGDKPLYACAP